MAVSLALAGCASAEPESAAPEGPNGYSLAGTFDDGSMLWWDGGAESGLTDLILEDAEGRMFASCLGTGPLLCVGGTDEARGLVRKTTLGFLQFPDGIDWDGNDVRVCVAIAAKGNEHMAVLSGLAQILMEPEQAEALRRSSSVDEVLELLSGIGEEDE